MGVWIETHQKGVQFHPSAVTPCMGVWIETLRTWVTGQQMDVTPCMGVWIETLLGLKLLICNVGHTLYGCVD